jgi:predicted permease
MEALLGDIRYGVRQLLRQRGSSLIAVLTLALGIGVSTALFSVIDATLLHPLPYPDPEQLVTVSPEETMPNGRVSRATASMEDMRTWQKSDDVFSFVAGSGSAFRGRIVDDAEPARLPVSYFTEDYLPMHGVEPRLGRNFTREDTEPGAPAVALLGDGYWKSHFGGRDDVLGKTLRFDTEIATIIGVLPPSFNATTPVSMPLQVPLSEYSRRGTGRVSVYARLQPGITIDQARERLTARMQPTTLPDGTKATNPTAAIRSRLDGALAQSRTTVNVLAGAVGLILLIACVNVAGLLLARGATRQSELAVRASLGAGRGRLVRQLLTESIVLAIPGGALGLLLAWLSLDAIVANIPLSISSNAPATLNLRVLAATIALLIPTAVLFGLAPALKLSRVHLGAVLARGGRQRSSALSRRGGQWLIGAEVALAVVLVAGAGLMIRSFVRINDVDLGFNPHGLTVMETMPIDQTPAVHEQFYRGV